MHATRPIHPCAQNEEEAVPEDYFKSGSEAAAVVAAKENDEPSQADKVMHKQAVCV